MCIRDRVRDRHENERERDTNTGERERGRGGWLRQRTQRRSEVSVFHVRRTAGEREGKQCVIVCVGCGRGGEVRAKTRGERRRRGVVACLGGEDARQEELRPETR
eukprot:1668243-Rhodomonas_salina.1